ncbi:MAG: hypothetical protein ABFC28_03035 [Rikenellaceae bacterium]
MEFLKILRIRIITRAKFLFFVLFLLGLSANQLNGQFYSLGNEPTRVKWQSITTENFQIIYPKGVDSLAQRYARLMESANVWVQKPLKIKANPIQVVLHPYNVMSNGVVVWAPKRVELITRPMAFGGYSQNWEKQLVVHEIRHIAQISKFEHGVFRPLSWLIGQQSQGIGIGLYIDKWALEGDAVVSETAFSTTGRGRDPEQLIYFKAAFLAGEYRSWREWKLGSGKRYTPDIYSLGYLINSFITLSSGNYFYMGDMTEYLVKHFYNPSGSRKAYQSSTGKKIKGHFEDIKDVLGRRWKLEDSIKAPFTPFRAINRTVNEYSFYKSVVAISTDSLYAVKWNMDEPAGLVFLDSTGNENKISYMGNLSSFITYGNGKLYWTEQVYSTRWEQESFSVLKSYDIKKGKISTNTHKSSYSNPAVSVTGDTIAVAEYSAEGRSALVFLESGSYKPVASFSAPENGQIKESVFFGKGIYATVITDKGMGLFYLNLKTGAWSKEIDEQNMDITRLNSYGEGLYFESDLDGTNNLYCYRPEIKFLQRLTNSRFGAFAPFLDGANGIVYYSEYDKNGYRAVSAKLNDLLWQPATFINAYSYHEADILSRMAGYSIDTVKVTFDTKYESKPYRKGANLFRPHSWAPFYYNVDKIRNISYDNFYEILSPGATVYSQNTLSTATAMLAYSYSNGFNAGHLKFSYSGFYPVIDIQADYNERNRREIHLVRDVHGTRFQVVTPIQNSPYFTTSFLFYLPLNFSRGGWSVGLIPKILWKYSNDSYYSVISGKYRDYQYLSVGLQYYNMLNSSKRDIYPKWGLGVNLQMNSVPFSEKNFGSLIYSNIYGYVPGFLVNHGLRISLAYQMQNYKGKNYLFSNIASSPRGYEKLYGKKFLSLSMDYAFPVYLGDTELSSFLYFKRLQVIPFVDWAYNQGALKDSHMFSAGSDLLLDFNILNIYLPLSVGLRYARTKEGTNLFQFLFKLPM